MPRKLVSLETISALSPIPGSSKLELATIKGWNVVVEQGAFKVGDKCIYFEDDSYITRFEHFGFLPIEEHPTLGRGVCVRTKKIRGVWSQGLALPLSFFDYLTNSPKVSFADIVEAEEFDVAKMSLENLIGVVKYEPPQILERVEKPLDPPPTKIKVKTFPSNIPQTDQERIQNIFSKLPDGVTYEVTLKLDGTSMTIFYDGQTSGICSRNNLITEENKRDHQYLLKVNEEYGDICKRLEIYCKKFNKALALQGEVMGPKIQKNREGFERYNYFVFDIYDIQNKRYLLPHKRRSELKIFNSYFLGGEDVPHVPVLHKSFAPTGLTCDDLLKMAETQEPLFPCTNPIIEGLVFKATDRDFHFKAISRKYLTKGGN